MLRTVPAWNNLGTLATFFISSILLGTIVNAAIWMSLVLLDGTFLSDLYSHRVIMIAYSMIIVLLSLQLTISLFTVIKLNSNGGAGAASVRYLWTNLCGMLIVRWLTAITGMVILLIGMIFWQSAAAFFHFLWARAYLRNFGQVSVLRIGSG